MGASAAAAVMLIKEKHIVEAFRNASATSASHAVVPSDLEVQQRLAFHKLTRRKVLLEAAPGRFYLDEARWEDLRQWRRRLALGLAILLLAVALLGLLKSGAV